MPPLLMPDSIEELDVLTIGGQDNTWYSNFSDGKVTSNFIDIKSFKPNFNNLSLWTVLDVPILNIILPEKLQYINAFSFANVNIEEIKIPNSVTSIGYYAFSNCIWLKSIKLPDGIKFIAEGLFKGCLSLEEIYIPDSVEEIYGNAFNSSAIKKIRLPNNIKKIHDGAFCNCINLSIIENIPNHPIEFISDKPVNIFYAIDPRINEIQEDLWRVTDIYSNTELKYYTFGGCNKLNMKTKAALRKIGYRDPFDYLYTYNNI